LTHTSRRLRRCAHIAHTSRQGLEVGTYGLHTHIAHAGKAASVRSRESQKSKEVGGSLSEVEGSRWKSWKSMEDFRGDASHPSTSGTCDCGLARRLRRCAHIAHTSRQGLEIGTYGLHTHIAHAGKVASVLAMEVSEVDCGAVLSPFSQYPAEEETCWNACSYLQNIQGKETVRVTEWGPVKILAVKTSANSKALTLEEIEVCGYLCRSV